MIFRFRHFQTRLMVFLLALLLVVLSAVYYFVNRQNIDNARDIILNDLEIGAGNLEALIAGRNESLAIAADALSADFAFKQVYASGDHDTILSAMYNLLDRLATADFMVLVSSDDRIIASTRDPSRRNTPPSWTNLIDRARDFLDRGQYPEAEGVAVIDGTPFHMSILPFMNPDPEAWIAIGFELGPAFAVQLRDSISAQVSIIFQDSSGTWHSHASTLPASQLSAMMADTPTMVDEDTPGMMTLAGEDYVTLTRPITSAEDPVRVVLQRSLSRQLVPYQALSATLLTIFAAGLAILALGVVIISRNVTRPVLELADKAGKIEAGNYQQSIDIAREDEIGQLGMAFNRMARGLAEKEKELARLAHYDMLTGLPNRLLLDSRLEHAIQRAQHLGVKLGVLYLDLDDFKSVNDSLGHSRGDQLLGMVAERFKARVREEDTLARLGGDDFIIIAESIDSPADAASLAEGLLNCLHEAFTLTEGQSVFANASIGISIYPDNGSDNETLIQNADTALYRAKQGGHNRLSFYSSEMGENATEQLELITALRHALRRDEFRVHYQAKTRIDSDEFAGAEALVRWERPGHGMVSPAKFIPVAEQSGLITPLGTLILEAVVRQIRAWLDSDMEPGVISINVSVRQFKDQNLVKLVGDAIDRHGIPPQRLALEITESALMEDPVQVQETLRELKALGVHIYLDDFGTGFSSFSYLSRFDLDVLKIDMSFIRNINQSGKDNQIVASMVSLARNLGMTAIAEGVEKEEQLDFLKKHHCDLYQGFLKSRPMPAEAFTAMLRPQTPPR